MFHLKTLRNRRLFLDLWVLQWCCIAVPLRWPDHLWELKCVKQKNVDIQVNIHSCLHARQKHKLCIAPFSPQSLQCGCIFPLDKGRLVCRSSYPTNIIAFERYLGKALLPLHAHLHCAVELRREPVLTGYKLGWCHGQTRSPTRLSRIQDRRQIL